MRRHPSLFTRVFLLLAIIGLVLAPAGSALAQATPVAGGLSTANMDLSVDPADDFYRFANGGWLDRTTIPPDWPSYGVFEEIYDLTEQQLIGLLTDAGADPDLVEGSDTWKAAQLFQQGLDIDARNAAGIDPIQPVLDQINAITDLDSFHEFLIGATFIGVSDLFNLTVITDFVDSSMTTVYLQGPFLGLPSVEFYAEGSPENEAVQQAYRDASAALLVLAGMDATAAAEAAEAYYAFEATLAEQMVTAEEAQDLSVIYNPTPAEDMAAGYPMLDWSAYLAALGLDESSIIVNSEVRLNDQLDEIVSGTSIETLKTFLTLKILWDASSVLSEDLEAVSFEYQQVVLGTEEQAPTEEEVLGFVNYALGDAVGQLYVAEYFPESSKVAVTALVEELLAAFRVRLESNTWMSPETKILALDKLDQMGLKLGFPDTWRSYAAVEIGGSYAESVQSAINAETRRVMAQAGKPVDKTEWFIPPQVVNAFYDPQNNEIVFPAAFLQAPFFDADADMATNYGAIGFVIGHEITHGFDLQGSQFDANGNFVDWWSAEDAAAFEALNQEAVALYDGIEVLPGVAVNGQLTVTENVADLGGLQVAYDALQIALAAGSDEPELIEGFTADQRFFISAATVWRDHSREESLATQVQTDTHAPATLRGVIPLQNVEAFYVAFDIGPGDAMYLPPEDRVVIW